MKTRRITRYIADCGRGFWNRNACEKHEDVCKCWTNQKNRTCKTCDFGRFAPYEDDTGYGGFWECNNHENPIEDHTGGPIGVDYISVGCLYYKNKN